MKKQTLCCLLQNRLGALDRVLGALTLRGILPEQWVTQSDSNELQVRVTFACNDEHVMALLVKALQKQVYVLQVNVLDALDAEIRQIVLAPPDNAVSSLSNVASIPNPNWFSEFRRDDSRIALTG